MLRVWSVGEESYIRPLPAIGRAAARRRPRRHAARSLPRQPTSHHATMNRGGAPSTAKPVTSNTQLGLLATVLVLSGLLACKQTNGSEREDVAACLRKP